MAEKITLEMVAIFGIGIWIFICLIALTFAVISNRDLKKQVKELDEIIQEQENKRNEH